MSSVGVIAVGLSVPWKMVEMSMNGAKDGFPWLVAYAMFAAVRQLKAVAVRDLVVGGPDVAAQAFAADECHLFLAPIVVGGGKRFLPDDVRLPLELLDERRFRNGTVCLRYRMRT
jgi:dihydrofolate reductase